MTKDGININMISSVVFWKYLHKIISNSTATYSKQSLLSTYVNYSLLTSIK